MNLSTTAKRLGLEAASGFALAFCAWAISCAWGWYIVPVGAPAISAVRAFGLMACLRIVRFAVCDRDMLRAEVDADLPLTDGQVALVRVVNVGIMLAIAWWCAR